MRQGPALLRLRAAFARGNSDSSFEVDRAVGGGGSGLVKSAASCSAPPPRTDRSVALRRTVAFRLERNQEYDDPQGPRTPEEHARCYHTRDDYLAFAKDSSLCLDSFRRVAQRGTIGTNDDDDATGSIRGLEDYATRPPRLRSFEVRKAQCAAVLELQRRLRAKGRTSRGEGVHERLKKMAQQHSRGCVQRAIAQARKDALYGGLAAAAAVNARSTRR